MQASWLLDSLLPLGICEPDLRQGLGCSVGSQSGCLLRGAREYIW